MNRTSNALAIATLVSIALSGGAAVAQETIPVLHPEEVLRLRCHGDMSVRRLTLQQFLRVHGFKVLDLSGINDHSGQTFSQNAKVVGIDAQSRIVELDSYDPPQTASFSLMFLAPPAGTPGSTKRFRDEIERLARQNLQCKVESVHYDHSTESEAHDYDQWARKIESAISEASRN